MTVFLDTFALIAWVHARDAAHAIVKAYLDLFSGRIVTTDWILLEFADAFAKASVKPHALKTIERIRQHPMFEVVPCTPAIFQAGYTLYANRTDKDWSLTDCISFAVMTQRGLTDALTADVHFEQAGFRAIFRTP